MADFDLGQLTNETFLLIARLAGPPLGAVLVAGILVSLLQAMTQVNEATLAFVPKVLALVAALALTGSAMLSALTDYANGLFAHIVTIGG